MFLATAYRGGKITKSAAGGPPAEPARLPGEAGAVRTVKIEGSGWSNETAFIGQNLVRSYL